MPPLSGSSSKIESQTCFVSPVKQYFTTCTVHCVCSRCCGDRRRFIDTPTTHSSSDSDSSNDLGLSSHSEQDITILERELSRAIDEEKQLVMLQMQLLVQRENLKLQIEQAENEAKLTKLAAQKARLDRMQRSDSEHKGEILA